MTFTLSRRAISVRILLLLLGLALLNACGRSGPGAPLPPPPTVNAAPLTPGPRTQLAASRAAFDAHPTDAAANLTYAKTLLAYELFEAADVMLQRAAALAPDDVDAPYLLGWMHTVTGNATQAVDEFARVLDKQPGHPQAMLRRADALRRLAQMPAAEQQYRALLKTYPDQPNAVFGLASVLEARGEHQEAIALLERLVEALPNFGPAQFTLARAYRAVGEEQRAQEHLAAYEVNRNWEPPFEDALVDAVKELNRNHLALFARSVKASNAGNWKQAAALLEEATSEDPSFLVGHLNLITCYAHLGEHDKVEKHYQQALALSPASAELQNTQGLYFKINGKREQARAHFQKAIEFDPEHYTSYENLGLLDYEAGDFEAALANYGKASTIAPQSPRSWLMLGTIYLKQGEQAAAERAFLEVLRPGPEANAALVSVTQAYAARHAEAAWTSLRTQAIERARRVGMLTVLPLLMKTTP